MGLRILEDDMAEFEGALHDDESLKRFFLTCDGLMSLEWRLFTQNIYGPIPSSTQEYWTYFERVVCDDEYLALEHRHIAPLTYLRMTLRQDWRDQFRMASALMFRGIDQLIIPIHVMENDQDVAPNISSMNPTWFRRVDVEFPYYGYQTTADYMTVREWCNKNGVMFNLITLYDPPEVDSWYSRPGYEGLVDPLPEPYMEDYNTYGVLSDSVTLVRDEIYIGDERKDKLFGPLPPITDKMFLPELLKAKVKAYSKHAQEIKNRDGNMYWRYFDWVGNNIEVDDDFSFIPSIMLPSRTKFHQRLVETGEFISTPLGLLKPNTPVRPIVRIRK